MNNTQKNTTVVDNVAIMADQKARANQRVERLCTYIAGLQLDQSASEELLRLTAEHVVSTETDALVRGFHMGAEYVRLISKMLERWNCRTP